MFAIINIVIVIITGKSYARTWSCLQDDASQCYLVPFSNPNGGKYSVAQGISSRFRSKMFNGVLLVISIRLPVSPLPPAKLSNDHPLEEALAMWPNKYHWFKRVISPEEHWLWIVFVGQIAVLFFKFSTIFLKNTSKLQLRNYISNNKNILDFVFWLCQI